MQKRCFAGAWGQHLATLVRQEENASATLTFKILRCVTVSSSASTRWFHNRVACQTSVSLNFVKTINASKKRFLKLLVIVYTHHIHVTLFRCRSSSLLELARPCCWSFSMKGPRDRNTSTTNVSRCLMMSSAPAPYLVYTRPSIDDKRIQGKPRDRGGAMNFCDKQRECRSNGCIYWHSYTPLPVVSDISGLERCVGYEYFAVYLLFFFALVSYNYVATTFTYSCTFWSHLFSRQNMRSLHQCVCMHSRLSRSEVWKAKGK